MSSDYVVKCCVNCLSTENLSPLHINDYEKLLNVTQLPIDGNHKNICAECRTLIELLASQIEVHKISINTIQNRFKEHRDESDDKNNASKGQKRKAPEN